VTTFRAALTAVAALAFAPAAAAGVLAYPSSQTIPASGRLPQGEASSVTLDAARGEREGAWIVASGAQSVSASIDGYALGPLQAALYFGHFVASGGRSRADALLPWNGEARATEKPNQPIYLQVVVPDDAKPGGYRATVRVTTDGRATEVAVSITVFPVRLPRPGTAKGNMLAVFHVIPQSYVKKVQELYNFPTNGPRAAANDSLFQFLSYYRISPAGWGFGEPRSQAGYTSVSSNQWWLDSAGNMVRQNQDGFPAMRIPISNQRTSAASRIAGMSPYAPEGWCDYLQTVHSFWDQHGWLTGHVPYLYALDEPDLAGMALVGRQASTAHSCFPGSQVLVTGNPTSSNRFLWDKKDGDDVDIWAVLSRRYYGQFNAPRQKLAVIRRVRRAGKSIWSTTYQGVPGTPGYTLTEPLSDPRMFLLWNALEGIRGTLYAEGTTSYLSGDPFASLRDNGEYVLIYPGAHVPIASARLEQIRDGIEDWDLLDIVRRKHGMTAVRRILGDAGLFSTSASGTILACSQGCELDGSTQYSWPEWSHDAATAARIEAAHLRALQLASS
jgi:hypothetical protein